MTIGPLAKRAGVNVETIRYYERRGLIDQPGRPEAGFRKYSPASVDRISFIKRARELGFTLKEVSELLLLRVDPDSKCEDVRTQAMIKIEDIASRIKTLQQMKKSLVKLAEACDQRAPTSECPILEALGSNEDTDD
jgi:MerR family mercuric resistance operon transcriptional regulator